MKLEQALAEAQLLRQQTEQKVATLQAVTSQRDELRAKSEKLELQLSTSVNQTVFLAMESQFNRKQSDLGRLNEQMTKLRQENFAMRASSSNNQLKVNNLNE